MNTERYIPLHVAADRMQVYGYDEERVEADDIWLMNETFTRLDEVAGPLSLMAHRFIEYAEDSQDLGEEPVEIAAKGLLVALHEHQRLMVARVNTLLDQRPGLFVVKAGDAMAEPTSVTFDGRAPERLVPIVGERPLFLGHLW